MAKTKISEFDTNPDLNTDINSINIAENCSPANINNAIRQLMSDLKDWQSGADDKYIAPAGTAAAPSWTFNGDTNTGFYSAGADQIGVAANGSSVGSFTSAGFVGNVTGNVTGNASTVTNGVYTTGDQTIAGVKTFSSSPVVPTAAVDDNSTAAASTAFVVAQIADDAPTKTGTGATGSWNINAATVTNGVYTTNFTGANQSLGSSGYQKLPGGLIMQWGSVTVTPAFNGTQSVTFPTAFASAVYSVTATPISVSLQGGDKRDSFSVQSVSTSGFTMNSAFENIASLTYYWIAIGV